MLRRSSAGISRKRQGAADRLVMVLAVADCCSGRRSKALVYRGLCRAGTQARVECRTEMAKAGGEAQSWRSVVNVSESPSQPPVSLGIPLHPPSIWPPKPNTPLQELCNDLHAPPSMALTAGIRPLMVDNRPGQVVSICIQWQRQHAKEKHTV